MANLFSSQIISSDGAEYKVDFDADYYIGIDADIIGGSGLVYYVASDWTDYIEPTQSILIDATSDTIVSFTYNAGSDRTEITVTTTSYSGQSTLANNPLGISPYAPTFSPIIKSLYTDWDGQGDEVLAAIKSSTTEVTYYDKDENLDGDQYAFFHRFIDLWQYRSDLQAKVIVYKKNGASWEMHWIGNAVPDLLEWSNMSSPRDYTFKAEDGLNLLKDIEYDGDLTSLSQVKLIDVIRDILALANLSSYWGSSDPYIRESIDMFTTQIASVTASQSPLDYTYIPENMLINGDIRTDREFHKAYDILEGIMELFSCRIFISKGIYYIQQVRNFLTPSMYTYRQFNRSNNTYTTGTITHQQVLEPLASGKFGYFPGLRKAYIYQDRHYTIKTEIGNGYLGEISVAGGGGTVFPAVSNPFDVDIGDVNGGLGNGKNMIVSMRLRQRMPIGVYVTLSITSGNKFIYAPLGGVPEWRDDAVTVDRYWQQYIAPVGSSTNTVVTFETPEIPSDMTAVNVEIEFTLNSTTSTGGSPVWGVFDFNILSTQGSDEANQVEVSVVNPTSDYTKDLEMPSLIITENSNLTSSNTLSVDENYIAGGGVALVETEDWDAGFTFDAVLSHLRVAEAMNLQHRSLYKYMGVFNGYYQPYFSIAYDDKVWVMNGMRFDYSLDEYDGEWFEVPSVRPTLGVIENEGGGIGGSEQGDTNGDMGMYRAMVNDRSIGIGPETTTAAGTHTTLGFSSLDWERIRAGDMVDLIHPETKELIDTFEVSTTPTVVSTSLAVVSQAVDMILPIGYIIAFSKGKVVESDIVRTDKIFTQNTLSAPVVIGDMEDGEVRVANGTIYIRYGSSINAVDVTTIIS